MRQQRKRATGSDYTAYMVRVTFVQVNPEIPNLFKDTFGGNIYFYSAPFRERTRGWHQWYIAGGKAVIVMNQLLPYFRLKGKQAQLAIELAQMMVDQRVNRNGQMLTDEQVKAREHLADAIRELNARRTHYLIRGNQETLSYARASQESLPVDRAD